MADQTSMHARTLAQWLDQPVHTLKARWRLLLAPAMAALVINLTMVLLGQLSGSAISTPGSIPGAGEFLLLFVVGLVLVPGMWALSEIIVTAGLVEVEETGGATMRGVLKRTFAVHVLTATAMRFLVHAAMIVVSMLTCGLGIFAWLFVLMYLPLVLPAAMREGLGGVAAVRRSMQLTWWRPTSGGPSTGSADRVVVAYHVVVGLAYALSALPSLPTAVWSGLTVWGLVVDGSFDPMSLESGALQAQLTPPIWLVVPVQAVTSTMGLLGSFYGAQLFLDLHRDLVDGRDGADFDRALDQLQEASVGG